MGDMGDIWNEVRANRRERSALLGIECPECKRLQPKRDATLLMPGQKCRVDGYRDPRPRQPE